MSATGGRHAHGAASAVDVETRAADWLQRQHFWDWSSEDQSGLEAWLGESAAHRVAYLRIKSGYGRTERLVALRNPKAEDLVPNRRRILGMAAAIAAVVTVAVMSSIYFFNSREIVYVTPIGGHKIIALADGSQIELNTDTTLVLNTDSQQRTARLEKGEAYFQIKHNAAHPFVLRTAQHSITDLGTKFLVRSEGDRVEVALVEGLARLKSDSASIQQHEALLRPGNVAVATTNTMSVAKEPARNLANELGWRRGVLVFRNATLADAAIALNRYNNNKLVIAGGDAARLTINGTFGTHDVRFFVRMAQTVFGLHVTNVGDSTIISR
jgi:transmembrane sensor